MLHRVRYQHASVKGKMRVVLPGSSSVRELCEDRGIPPENLSARRRMASAPGHKVPQPRDMGKLLRWLQAGIDATSPQQSMSFGRRRVLVRICAWAGLIIAEA